MAKQATRAELAAAVIELYEELTQIKGILSRLIGPEVDAKMLKYLKQYCTD